MVNQEERTHRVWGVLTEVADRQEVITYEELAHRVGIHHRAVKFPLALIQDYCRKTLPPLTILVVNKHTHLPGAGFIAKRRDQLAEGYSEVYRYR